MRTGGEVPPAKYKVLGAKGQSQAASSIVGRAGELMEGDHVALAGGRTNAEHMQELLLEEEAWFNWRCTAAVHDRTAAHTQEVLDIFPCEKRACFPAAFPSNSQHHALLHWSNRTPN